MRSSTCTAPALSKIKSHIIHLVTQDLAPHRIATKSLVFAYQAQLTARICLSPPAPLFSLDPWKLARVWGRVVGRVMGCVWAVMRYGAVRSAWYCRVKRLRIQVVV